MYAIVEIAGKQFKVCAGSVVYSERVETAEGSELSLKVLSYYDDQKLSVGAPYLDIAALAKVVKHGKAKKVTVFKYKAKKNYKRKIGHRQRYTKLEIVSIGN